MARIQFEEPDETLGRLQEVFGRDVSQQIGAAAFKEWAGWLLGRERPQTIPAVETQRAISLYTDIFCDDLPSAQHLGTVLRLPPARCRYIIQAMRYIDPDLLTKRWLRAVSEAYDRITEEDGRYMLDVEPDCREVVDQVLREIQDANNLAELDRPRRRGSRLRYELSQGYYERIQAALNAALEAVRDRNGE